MRAIRLMSLLAAAGTLALAGPAEAQDASECYIARGDLAGAQARPSPLKATAITLGEDEATLCYGSPSAKGRTIMGELVPFGAPWRTGANEATALHLPFDAQIGGINVEAGVYSLYTVPGESEWEIVLNRQYERWGIPISAEVRGDDVMSVTRSAAATEEMVEELTFRWDSHGEMMGHLVMEWEHTRLEIPIHKGGMH